MNKSRFILWDIFTPLLVACILYLLFRPVDTLIFQLFIVLHLEEHIILLREVLPISSIPSWVVYSLPGGLWLLAFQNTICLLKQFEFKKILIPVLVAFSIGSGLEIIQKLNITDGRFDWLDIILYSIATIVSLLTAYLVQHKWEFYTDEKTSPKLIGFFYLFFVAIIYLADII